MNIQDLKSKIQMPSALCLLPSALQRRAIAFSGTIFLLVILLLGIFGAKFYPHNLPIKYLAKVAFHPRPSASIRVHPRSHPQKITSSIAPPLNRPDSLSLSDRQLQTAQKLVQYLPTASDSYNQLAAAYLQKGRETGDFSYTQKAETALDRSLQLEPNNKEALKLRAVLLLTYHRFSTALDLTEQLQQRYPQDPQIYAAMTDALVELGDYAAAKTSIQSLLDLHPSAPGYARQSYLLALHGDDRRAIAAMQKAVESAQPQDREGLAWYRVYLGNELLHFGKLAAAEREFDRALQIFPEYHLALAARAKAFFAAGDADNAITYYRRALARIPLPEIAIALGNLYAHLGNQTAADRQYQLVNFLEQTGGEAFRQAYAQQLAIFWADRETRLDEALALIQQERLTRSDIYTLDALAWCLFKLGRLVEAKQAIAQAMRLGTRDARINYHAGRIYLSCGDVAAAKKLLQKALAIDLVFDPLQAAIARKILTAIASTTDAAL